jgi:hypothetical protein
MPRPRHRRPGRTRHLRRRLRRPRSWSSRSSSLRRERSRLRWTHRRLRQPPTLEGRDIPPGLWNRPRRTRTLLRGHTQLCGGPPRKTVARPGGGLLHGS